MSKRILLVDSDPGAAAAINASAKLNLSVTLLSKDPAARSWFAGKIIEGNPSCAEDVVKAISESGAHGIWLPFNETLPACAIAAERCGLAGVGETAASIILSRSETYQRLNQHGVPALKWIRGDSASELKRLAESLETPLWVAGDAAYALSATSRLDFADDAPLAFSRATRRGALNAVAVAKPIEGRQFYVDYAMISGEVQILGVIGRDIGESPFMFDRAAFSGRGEMNADCAALTDVATRAIDALEISSAAMRVSVTISNDSLVVSEIALGPSSSWFPVDLIRMSSGVDEMAVAINIALGEAPLLRRSRDCGAALRWIPTHSGVISEILGIDAARSIPGVVEVAALVKPGDVMRHVLDCETRDRIGYVAAEGETSDDARGAVDRAVKTINIVTRPAF